ncbi:hypothetical protein [Phytoactinopolyspora halotolerans]|uniref:Uncharacterized protein n=1 Tax=Phytoactinopolyspora halotolerans TaxID=1981512 RepID=A0A6L9SD44_9ACTN|nr:hypothetical protein [Phytoactinopolyspora halotolerans]NEE03017.1 hypothetical protein [Phytoactinopolyspora halotolerans]
MRKGTALAIAILALSVSACGSDDDDATTSPRGSGTPDSGEHTPTPEPTPTAEEEPMPEPTQEPTGEETPTRPVPDLTPAPPTPGERPVTGEVPDTHMDAVIADAVERSGASAEDLTVVRSQAVQWSDGSLGCPEPGQVYTQAIVDGYWVELETDDEHLDYRLRHDGSFRLCTSPSTHPPLKKQPGT